MSTIRQSYYQKFTDLIYYPKPANFKERLSNYVSDMVDFGQRRYALISSKGKEALLFSEEYIETPDYLSIALKVCLLPITALIYLPVKFLTQTWDVLKEKKFSDLFDTKKFSRSSPLHPNSTTYDLEDRLRRSPIDYVAKKGDAEGIKILLKIGAEVRGTAALFLATRSGSKEAVQALVDAGVDVNQPCGDGSYPLAYVVEAETGSVEVCKVLLQAGAKIDQESKDGTTALMTASAWQNEELVEFLVHEGASVVRVNKEGITPLMDVTEFASSKTIELMIKKGAQVNACDREGETALMHAAQYGNLEAVQALIASNANVNLIDETGRSALCYAVECGHRGIVKALLQAGANVNPDGREEEKPLILAARRKDSLELVKDLLEAGAKVNQRDYSKNTPLMEASKRSDVELMQVLTEAGASVNVVNFNGENALIACLKGSHSKEAVAFLLSKGANVNRVSATSETPLRLAVKIGDSSLVQQLIDARARLNHTRALPALELAANYGRVDILRLLLDQGADVNKTLGQQGVSPLMSAAAGGYRAAVKLLLEYNPKVDYQAIGCSKRTALHEAAMHGHIAVVEDLINAGANVRLLDAREHTALSYLNSSRMRYYW